VARPANCPSSTKSNCIPTSLSRRVGVPPRTRHHHRIVEPVGSRQRPPRQSNHRVGRRRTRNPPAQAILAWHVSLGSIPIPKSKSLERQRQNLTIFDVSLTADNVIRSGRSLVPMAALRIKILGVPRVLSSTPRSVKGRRSYSTGSSDFNVESATRHPTRMILHSLISTWPRERRRRSPRG